MLDGEGAGPAGGGADAGPGSADEADAALDQIIDETAPALEAALEADETPAAQPAAEGRPAPARDEQGRFTPRAPTGQPQAPPAGALDQPPETPGEPNAEAAPEGAQPAGEPEPELPPFSVRADGGTVDFPGSAVGDDGVYFPPDQVPELQRLVANGKVYEGSFRQRLNQAALEVTREKARADGAERALSGTFAKLEEMMANGTLTEWLANVQQNLPIMRAEAKAKAAERQLELERTQREQLATERERSTTEPAMAQALETLLLRYAQPYDLGAPQLAVLYQRLNSPRFRAQVFQRAAADDARLGVRRGEWLVDQTIVADEVRHYAEALGRRAVTPEERARIAAAADKNRRSLTPGKGGAPPAVSARRGPAPKAGGKVPKFASTEEADAWYDKNGFLDLVEDEVQP